MKRLATLALALSLLALECAEGNQDGNTAGSGTSPTTPVQDPRAINISRSGGAVAEEPHVPFVRIAELEIDPTQLESYKEAVKEEMETSVRVEPGVLAIYAVAEKSNPSKLRFFEMYADEAAYNAHIESAHFKKYAKTTKGMITSRRLIDTVPILLSAKKK
jgi:quinol monooxygenase YgiN